METLADLESISPAFERRVRTNTRWKILLHNKDPDHLELVSRSYGTKTTFKRTVRFKQGPLGTLLNAGETSNREVQEFLAHPDALKSLAPCAQGYVLFAESMEPVSFSMLPSFDVTNTPLPKNPPGSGLGLYERFVGLG